MDQRLIDFQKRVYSSFNLESSRGLSFAQTRGLQDEGLRESLERIITAPDRDLTRTLAQIQSFLESRQTAAKEGKNEKVAAALENLTTVIQSLITDASLLGRNFEGLGERAKRFVVGNLVQSSPSALSQFFKQLYAEEPTFQYLPAKERQQRLVEQSVMARLAALSEAGDIGEIEKLFKDLPYFETVARKKYDFGESPAAQKLEKNRQMEQKRLEAEEARRAKEEAAALKKQQAEERSAQREAEKAQKEQDRAEKAAQKEAEKAQKEQARAEKAAQKEAEKREIIRKNLITGATRPFLGALEQGAERFIKSGGDPLANIGINAIKYGADVGIRTATAINTNLAALSNLSPTVLPGPGGRNTRGTGGPPQPGSAGRSAPQGAAGAAGRAAGSAAGRAAGGAAAGFTAARLFGGAVQKVGVPGFLIGSAILAGSIGLEFYLNRAANSAKNVSQSFDDAGNIVEDSSNDVASNLAKAGMGIGALTAIFAAGGAGGLAGAAAAAGAFSFEAYTQSVQQGIELSKRNYSASRLLSSSLFGDMTEGTRSQQSFSAALLNNNLTKFGFDPLEIAQAYTGFERRAAFNINSDQYNNLVYQTGIAAREFGSSLDETVSSIGNFRRAGLLGGVDQYLQIARSVSPTGAQGLTDFSRVFADAFISAGKQMAITSGGRSGEDRIAGLALMQNILSNADNQYIADLASQNPELATQTASQLGNFIRSGLGGGNQMATGLALRAGLSFYEMGQGFTAENATRIVNQLAMETDISNFMRGGDFNRAGLEYVAVQAGQLSINQDVLAELLRASVAGELTTRRATDILQRQTGLPSGEQIPEVLTRGGDFEAIYRQEYVSRTALITALGDELETVLNLNRGLAALTLSVIQNPAVKEAEALAAQATGSIVDEDYLLGIIADSVDRVRALEMAREAAGFENQNNNINNNNGTQNNQGPNSNVPVGNNSETIALVVPANAQYVRIAPTDNSNTIEVG